MAQKKSNVGLWIGIGCGGLLLLSALGSGVVYYYTASKAVNELKQVAEVAVGSGAGTTTSGTGTTTSGAESSSSGGGVCAQAVACCKAIIQKSGGDATALSNCDNFSKMPEIGCTRSLDTFKKSAIVVGATCD